MKKFLKKTAGLVLAEALLAIAMLAIGTLVLGNIMNTAASTTALSKHYLIAQNLATEGIEAVKSLRDTNWLLYPDNPECWLKLNPEKPECGDLAQAENHYIIRKNKDHGKWEMVEIAGIYYDLNLESGPDDDKYRLNIQTHEAGKDKYNTYVHDSGYPESIFYRGVNVKEIADIDGDGFEDYAVFEIVVEWREGKKVRSLKRSVVLYNRI
jgi:hypothetical protein